jgi:hypothetical protein
VSPCACADDEVCAACAVIKLAALEKIVDELIAQIDALLQLGGDLPSTSLH